MREVLKFGRTGICDHLRLLLNVNPKKNKITKNSVGRIAKATETFFLLDLYKMWFNIK